MEVAGSHVTVAGRSPTNVTFSGIDVPSLSTAKIGTETGLPTSVKIEPTEQRGGYLEESATCAQAGAEVATASETVATADAAAAAIARLETIWNSGKVGERLGAPRTRGSLRRREKDLEIWWRNSPVYGRCFNESHKGVTNQCDRLHLSVSSNCLSDKSRLSRRVFLLPAEGRASVSLDRRNGALRG